MAENIKLNDEAMANAAGGELDPYQDIASITGIVMVNPLPDHPDSYIWDECQQHGYSVYEIDGHFMAIAKPGLEPFNPGDRVYYKRIRGFYGYEITGRAE